MAEWTGLEPASLAGGGSQDRCITIITIMLPLRGLRTIPQEIGKAEGKGRQLGRSLTRANAGVASLRQSIIASTLSLTPHRLIRSGYAAKLMCP